jgi:hypothetical protein
MKTSRILNGIAIFLLILTALNALAAGYSMIVEPTGKDLGMQAGEVLKYSPFSSFLIPGLVLFIMIGVGCLITSYFMIKKIKHHDLLLIAQGIVITGWIVIQVAMFREFNWMHAFVGSTGLYLTFCGYNLHKKMTVTI